MIPLCIDQGLAVLPWSPLARGFLTGSRTREGGSTRRFEGDNFAKQLYFKESDFKIADKVREIAEKRGIAPAQVACAWVLQAPGVTSPIIGATKTEQLRELIAAVEVKLTAEEVAALEGAYEPHGILGYAPPSPKTMAART